MAWTNPTTRSAGDAILASDQNIWVNNFRMGQPVFTNEAARDAALTSLEEGMTAYLTASSETTADGGGKAIPTGITTVYNGTGWVCITPVSAWTDTVGTTVSLSYGTLTGGGTNPYVELRTGAQALVQFSMNSSLSAGPHQTAAGIAVSGATTRAVGATNNNSYALYSGAGAGYNGINCACFTFTDLTPGINRFTLNYATSNAAVTASFFTRRIIAQGIA
jgi:hypothetical protein